MFQVKGNEAQAQLDLYSLHFNTILYRRFEKCPFLSLLLLLSVYPTHVTLSRYSGHSQILSVTHLGTVCLIYLSVFLHCIRAILVEHTLSLPAVYADTGKRE